MQPEGLPTSNGPVPGQRSQQKRFGFLALLLASAIALTVGAALGALGNGSPATAQPAATVTATATVTKTVTETAGSEPTDEPAEEATEDTSGFSAKASDFKIGIKILSKKCFGSAGCSVTYRIKPEYVGDQSLPSSGTVEVTYRVKGNESGPQANTFPIEDGEASYEKEEYLSTPSSGTSITAKVIEVSCSE